MPLYLAFKSINLGLQGLNLDSHTCKARTLLKELSPNLDLLWNQRIKTILSFSWIGTNNKEKELTFLDLLIMLLDKVRS